MSFPGSEYERSSWHSPDSAVGCRNVAPEVLDPELQRKDSEGYGPEVDLWAVGVVLYSMLCGFPPFYSENNADLMQMIRRAEYCFHSPYWDDVSFGAKDLVASLLVANPCRRFTSHQCLAHQWIKHAGDASSQKLHRCDEDGKVRCEMHKFCCNARARRVNRCQC